MTLFWQYFGRLKKYQGKVWISLICHLLTAVFTVFSIPMIIPFFQLLFDSPVDSTVKTTDDIGSGLIGFYETILNNNDKSTALLYVCGALVLVFLFKNIFQYLSRYFMIPVRNGIIRDLRNDLFQKSLDLPISFYKHHQKGDLLTRFSADTLDVETSILKVVEVVIKSPIIIIGSILFMFYFSPQMTGFVFILLIFTVLVIGGLTRSLKRKSREAQASLGQLMSTAEETISGIKVVKSFRGSTYQKDKFENENNRYKNLIDRVLRRNDLSSPLSEFLGIAVVAVLMWYGSSLVFAAAMEPATFFAFILAFYHIIEPSKSFSSAFYSIQKGTAAMERIDHILTLDNDIKNANSPKFLKLFQKGIEFKDVSFSYEKDEKTVINKLSFKIEKGEKIAIVGASGEGKTTLIDLLMRYYETDRGDILIDDNSIRDIDLSNLRDQYAMVDQNAALFHDTVAHNIAMSDKDLDLKRIHACARAANAHEFISVLSNGYHSKIGEQGTKLSGGQRQRIILARALYKNAPIILLDEATSSLDSESEKLIQESLVKVLENKTAIIIAHRLNTIKSVDRILVLKNGSIIESGDHESLIDRKGAYYDMVMNQGL